MIDLHTHSVYSDGSCSVKELLQIANDIQLEYFSITDHNSVEAYYDEDMKSANLYYQGKIIKGVEITCMYSGRIVEVLGYDFDLNKMQYFLDKYELKFEEKQKREFELIKAHFSKIGIKFKIENILFDSKRESSRKAFLNEILKYPENLQFFNNINNTVSSKFTRNEIYNPNSLLFVDESSLYPDLATVVNFIHQCGGKAILAHLFIYDNSTELLNNLDSIVKETQLDGLECKHSDFTNEQTEILENYCNSLNLLKSGGSDFHGLPKPLIKIGEGKGNLNVLSNYLNNWKFNL